MITPAQREARRKSMGASDCPKIILGEAGDVYYSKIESLDEIDSEPIRVGNRMESLLIDMAEERYGEIVRDPLQLSFVDEDYSELSANLDGYKQEHVEGDVHKGIGFEAKYVGPQYADTWGDNESDQVPDKVQLQCQHQMRVACLDEVHLPIAIVRPYVGLRFEWFHLERDDDIIEAIVEAELRFWKNHVVPRVPPADKPALEVLKRIGREVGKVIDLPIEAGQALEAWTDAKAEARDAESAVDYAYRHLLAMLCDAECGRLPDGSTLRYATENAGARLIDAKAARGQYPHLFENTTRRVLRVKKASK